MTNPVKLSENELVKVLASPNRLSSYLSVIDGFGPNDFNEQFLVDLVKTRLRRQNPEILHQVPQANFFHLFRVNLMRQLQIVENRVLVETFAHFPLSQRFQLLCALNAVKLRALAQIKHILHSEAHSVAD